MLLRDVLIQCLTPATMAVARAAAAAAWPTFCALHTTAVARLGLRQQREHRSADALL